ncbi:MAG: hypothetical protein EHM55_21185 [Acidobacteria bacterium]|nr:MAG: hypothetical protein EHM55_21185 [Acidobacteriota bacterium]
MVGGWWLVVGGWWFVVGGNRTSKPIAPHAPTHPLHPLHPIAPHCTHCTHCTLYVIPFVVRAEFQPRVHQLDVVGGDFVPQQPSRGGVVDPRHDKPPGEASQPRDDDQRNLLALAPGHRANLPVRDKTAFRPDAIGIETAADPTAQGHQIAVIEKHHADAEDLWRRPFQHEQIVRQEHAQHHAQRQLQSVIARARSAPRQLSRRSPPQKPEGIDADAHVRHEKADTQQQQKLRGIFRAAHTTSVTAVRTNYFATGFAGNEASVGSKHRRHRAS